MKKITIAIDGFSSCGKSTMAKTLARNLGYVYVDTGAMYRAVTLFALRHNLFVSDDTVDENALAAAMKDIDISFKVDESSGHPDTILNGENVETHIRSMSVSTHVSRIAAIDFVRDALVEQQRRMGESKGVVMDGRDIGTVVFPNAELKIFVTASADVRAQRRFDELCAKGVEADFDKILQNVKQRDHIDTHRAVSPLRRAADAVELDNSRMTINQQNEWLLKLALERIEKSA